MEDKALSSGSVSKKPKVKIFFIIYAIQWIAIIYQLKLRAFSRFEKLGPVGLGTICELRLLILFHKIISSTPTHCVLLN